VLKKYHEIGDNINYGGNTEAGAGVFDIAQLADTEDMRAEVDINESDISRISMGTSASVIPDSYADKSYDAKVVKIYPAADRQKGTVKVEVHLINPDLTIIKPELSVKVTFLAGPPSSKPTRWWWCRRRRSWARAKRPPCGSCAKIMRPGCRLSSGANFRTASK